MATTLGDPITVPIFVSKHSQTNGAVNINSRNTVTEGWKRYEKKQCWSACREHSLQRGEKGLALL